MQAGVRAVTLELSARLWLSVSVGVVALLLFLWWAWWWLPKHQARRLDLIDDKARADVEDNFRKTIGQLIGGAAVLIGAAFAYLQFAQQQETAQQQQRAAHDLLISNQVAKGFELLGNKEHELPQRLGGIYTLEGVMNDPASQQYHKPVLEALCAFIRDETTDKTGDESPGSDIQAALTVIGRRAEDVIGKSIIDKGYPTAASLNLAATHLPNADLGSADLRHAFLTHANLRGAYLGFSNLRGANLHRAHLAGAYLGHSDLGLAELSDADLTGADLTEADLTGALHLTKEQLERACVKDVKGLDKLDPPIDPPLTIKSCPAR